MDVVFDLTAMTRHADAERKIVIEGFEADKRRLLVAVFGAIPGLAIGAMLTNLLGVVAIIPAFVTAAAAVWLFDSRSRNGLRLRNWDALNDRRKSKPKFLYCGRVIDPDDVAMYRIRSLSAPVQRPAESEWLMTVPAPRARRAARSVKKPKPSSGVPDAWEQPPSVASPFSVDGW